MISLGRLRTFVEVARTGSVAQAAERLVISQPAVSSALAGLARELGVALVERAGRGLQLTAAGTTLAREGERVFAQIDEAIRRTQASANGTTFPVKIAAITTVAEAVLPPILRGFVEGDGEVTLEVANREFVWNELRHRSVELVVAGRPPHDGSFVTLATAPNELVVIAAAGHAVEAGALGTATWLLREPGSGTRETTREFFALLGITPPELTIGSNGAVRECVRAGLGVSLIAYDAVRRDVEDGSLVVVPTAMTPLRRAWHLVADGSRPLSEEARRFVEHVVATSPFSRGESP